MTKKLMMLFLASALGACSGVGTIDDGADDELSEDEKADALITGSCTSAGGTCTSTVFIEEGDSPCGDEAEIEASCGAHTFRVCCAPAVRSRGAAAAVAVVNPTMPATVVKYMNDNMMGNHHLGWHMSRQWSRLSPSDQAWMKSQGWSMAASQEGMPGNGLEFLAMHRAVLNLLTTLPELKTSRALFAGWKRVPDPADRTIPKTGTNSLAGNPLSPNANYDIPEPLRSTIAMCQDKPDELKRFATDDDFGRFIETSAQQFGVPGVGLHNYLHNRYSQPGSTVDLGDPQKNFKNKIFWRLHGFIDRCWTSYRTVTGKLDDDPAYVAAIAKGAREMHLSKSAAPAAQAE